MPLLGVGRHRRGRTKRRGNRGPAPDPSGPGESWSATRRIGRRLEGAGHEFGLAGEVPAGGKLAITVVGSMFSLNNDGDDVELVDGVGVVRSRVSYAEDQVRRGEWVEVGE